MSLLVSQGYSEGLSTLDYVFFMGGYFTKCEVYLEDDFGNTREVFWEGPIHSLVAAASGVFPKLGLKDAPYSPESFEYIMGESGAWGERPGRLGRTGDQTRG